MANSPFTIPEGFPELLQDFTVSVLRERPNDVVEYAVSYFTDLANRRNPNRNQDGASNGISEHISAPESETAATTVIENVEDKMERRSGVKFQDEAEEINSDEDGPPTDAPAPLIDMANIQRDDDVYSDDG